MTETSVQPSRKPVGMFKRILAGLALVIVLFLIFVAMQPTDFRITRSATFAAPLEVVFAQVNDFHKWEAWSPWAKLDPSARNTFEGSASGQGAVFAWAGNDKVGEGRMAITESHPNDLIRIKLDFIKPFESTCTTEFTFKADGNQTTATWSMFGKRAFMDKAFCLFVNMDQMVGGDFERGFAQMKTVAEGAAKK